MVNELNDMAKLAIKGHPIRGKEVIEILKMLGGNNKYHINIAEWNLLYTIREGDNVIIATYPTGSILQIFTLEEFLEKYPYKVGDTVIAYAEGCIAQFTIQDMRWNYELNKVEYKICSSWCDTSLMQPYKEETMDKVSKTVFDANAQCCDISNKIIKKETMEKEISGAIVDRFICLEGYDFYDDKGNIIDTKEITMRKKKSEYPKTYEECCKVLSLKPEKATYSVCGLEYKRHLIVNFQRLLVCRDAYWKIAGEEMGFGKPFEPDWSNAAKRKYCIVNTEGNVLKWVQKTTNKILAFPTEEMRDAFKENFKELIESCKELL